MGVVAVAATLTACAPAASDEEIEHRFAVELASATGAGTVPEDFARAADGIAEGMRSGDCGSTVIPGVLAREGSEDLVYAWYVTCLMYFEGDMTPSQVRTAKQLVIGQLGNDRD